MDIKALTRQIKEKERILFKELIRVNNACLEKYKSDYFRDLPYQAQKQAVALVCGGWIRDKFFQRKDSSFDIDLIIRAQHFTRFKDLLVSGSLQGYQVREYVLHNEFANNSRLVKINVKVGEEVFMLDLREYKHRSLEKDLLSRDFGINSIYFDFMNIKIFDSPISGSLGQALSSEVARQFRSKILVWGASLANIFRDPTRYIRAVRYKNLFSLGLDPDMKIFVQNNASGALAGYKLRKRIIIDLYKTLSIAEFGRCILDMIELRMIPGLLFGVRNLKSEAEIFSRGGEIKRKLQLMILYQNFLGELGFRGFSDRKQYQVIEKMRVAFRVMMMIFVFQKDNSGLNDLIHDVNSSHNLFFTKVKKTQKVNIVDDLFGSEPEENLFFARTPQANRNKNNYGRGNRVSEDHQKSLSETIQDKFKDDILSALSLLSKCQFSNLETKHKLKNQCTKEERIVAALLKKYLTIAGYFEPHKPWDYHKKLEDIKTREPKFKEYLERLNFGKVGFGQVDTDVPGQASIDLEGSMLVTGEAGQGPGAQFVTHNMSGFDARVLETGARNFNQNVENRIDNMVKRKIVRQSHVNNKESRKLERQLDDNVSFLTFQQENSVLSDDNSDGFSNISMDSVGDSVLQEDPKDLLNAFKNSVNKNFKKKGHGSNGGMGVVVTGEKEYRLQKSYEMDIEERNKKKKMERERERHNRESGDREPDRSSGGLILKAKRSDGGNNGFGVQKDAPIVQSRLFNHYTRSDQNSNILGDLSNRLLTEMTDRGFAERLQLEEALNASKMLAESSGFQLPTQNQHFGNSAQNGSRGRSEGTTQQILNNLNHIGAQNQVPEGFDPFGLPDPSTSNLLSKGTDLDTFVKTIDDTQQNVLLNQAHLNKDRNQHLGDKNPNFNEMRETELKVPRKRHEYHNRRPTNQNEWQNGHNDPQNPQNFDFLKKPKNGNLDPKTTKMTETMFKRKSSSKKKEFDPFFFDSADDSEEEKEEDEEYLRAKKEAEEKENQRKREQMKELIEAQKQEDRRRGIDPSGNPNTFNQPKDDFFGAGDGIGVGFSGGGLNNPGNMQDFSEFNITGLVPLQNQNRRNQRDSTFIESIDEIQDDEARHRLTGEPIEPQKIDLKKKGKGGQIDPKIAQNRPPEQFNMGVVQNLGTHAVDGYPNNVNDLDETNHFEGDSVRLTDSIDIGGSLRDHREIDELIRTKQIYVRGNTQPSNVQSGDLDTTNPFDEGFMMEANQEEGYKKVAPKMVKSAVNPFEQPFSSDEKLLKDSGFYEEREGSRAVEGNGGLVRKTGAGARVWRSQNLPNLGDMVPKEFQGQEIGSEILNLPNDAYSQTLNSPFDIGTQNNPNEGRGGAGATLAAGNNSLAYQRLTSDLRNNQTNLVDQAAGQYRNPGIRPQMTNSSAFVAPTSQPIANLYAAQPYLAPVEPINLVTPFGPSPAAKNLNQPSSYLRNQQRGENLRLNSSEVVDIQNLRASNHMRQSQLTNQPKSRFVYGDPSSSSNYVSNESSGDSKEVNNTGGFNQGLKMNPGAPAGQGVNNKPIDQISAISGNLSSGRGSRRSERVDHAPPAQFNFMTKSQVIPPKKQQQNNPVNKNGRQMGGMDLPAQRKGNEQPRDPQIGVREKARSRKSRNRKSQNSSDSETDELNESKASLLESARRVSFPDLLEIMEDCIHKSQKIDFKIWKKNWRRYGLKSKPERTKLLKKFLVKNLKRPKSRSRFLVLLSAIGFLNDLFKIGGDQNTLKWEQVQRFMIFAEADGELSGNRFIEFMLVYLTQKCDEADRMLFFNRAEEVTKIQMSKEYSDLYKLSESSKM